MALLDDIIDEATSKGGEVTRLLRLCMVLGSRLQYAPLTEWATLELEGYPESQTVPPYRLFVGRNRGHFMGAFVGTFDIPLRVIPEHLRPQFERHEERSAIAEIAALSGDSNGQTNPKIPWPVEFTMKFTQNVVNRSHCSEAWTEISAASLAGVLDQVKTRVLNFALRIERELPDSRDITEISGPIKGATVPNIFNTTILGNVQNLSQGDTGTTQIATAGVTAGDLEGLIAALRGAGVPDQDIASLRVAAGESASVKDANSKATAIRKWLTDFGVKAATGAATSVVSKLVLGYLGSSVDPC